MTADVLRVVDSHHHLWDLTAGRYPWLQGPPQDPADVTGVGPLQRDYLPADLRADAAGVPLVASVHVEAAPGDPVAETRWLHGLTATTGLPSAVVAAVRLEDPALPGLLDRHAEHPGLRGVRQMLDHTDGVAGPTRLLGDQAWRRGLHLLAVRGLSFDLQVLPEQLSEAAEVAAAEPDLVLVLNHGGYHVPASGTARRHWLEGIDRLARRPNVVVKASGYDAVDPTWQPDGFLDYVHRLLEAFGPDRTMFGSNFPVDGRTTSYPALVAACREATTGLTPTERDAFFARNAARTYRLEIPDHPSTPLREP